MTAVSFLLVKLEVWDRESSFGVEIGEREGDLGESG